MTELNPTLKFEEYSIVWTENFSIGVERIDNQHKKLIEILNTFVKSIVGRRGLEAILETLDDLVKYSHVHFDSEENLMESIGYAHFEEHREKHNNLINKIEEYYSRIQKNDRIYNLEILAFLNDWLTNHILIEDMKIKEHYLAKGIS